MLLACSALLDYILACSALRDDILACLALLHRYDLEGIIGLIQDTQDTIGVCSWPWPRNRHHIYSDDLSRHQKIMVQINGYITIYIKF